MSNNSNSSSINLSNTNVWPINTSNFVATIGNANTEIARAIFRTPEELQRKALWHAAATWKKAAERGKAGKNATDLMNEATDLTKLAEFAEQTIRIQQELQDEIKEYTRAAIIASNMSKIELAALYTKRAQDAKAELEEEIAQYKEAIQEAAALENIWMKRPAVARILTPPTLRPTLSTLMTHDVARTPPTLRPSLHTLMTHEIAHPVRKIILKPTTTSTPNITVRRKHIVKPLNGGLHRLYRKQSRKQNKKHLLSRSKRF